MSKAYHSTFMQLIFQADLDTGILCPAAAAWTHLFIQSSGMHDYYSKDKLHRDRIVSSGPNKDWFPLDNSHNLATAVLHPWEKEHY